MMLTALISTSTSFAIPVPSPKWKNQSVPLDDYIEFTVQKGDTLDKLLQKGRINANDRINVVSKLRPYYSPTSIKLGQVIRIYYQGEDFDEHTLSALRINTSRTDFIELRRLKNDNYHVIEGSIPLETELVAATGTITSTLFESAKEQKIPNKILYQTIKLLSYDVDFQRDLRKGDEFTVLYEKKFNTKGVVVDSGNIIYLKLALKKKTVEMYRFPAKNGSVYYFTPEGKSIKKSLLATPVDGYRISSGFGLRKHPILGYNRMHKGIDFAAPRGTPIYAAGNGTIARVGRNGGYGNYIRIDHGRGYATAYAHMRRFAKGIHKGTKVKQGQVIGYVGTTGRSTGPHLHYEVLVNGKQVNPQSIKTTPGRKLSGIYYGIFHSYQKTVQERIRQLLNL